MTAEQRSGPASGNPKIEPRSGMQRLKTWSIVSISGAILAAAQIAAFGPVGIGTVALAVAALLVRSWVAWLFLVVLEVVLVIPVVIVVIDKTTIGSFVLLALQIGAVVFVLSRPVRERIASRPGGNPALGAEPPLDG